MPFALPEAGLLVAAPPTLLRHGLLLTLREAWPERRIEFTTDPTQLLEHLRTQVYALLIVDSGAFAAPVLPTVLQQVRRLHARLPLLVLTGRRPPVLPLAGPVRLMPQQAPPAEVARAAHELLTTTPIMAAPAHADPPQHCTGFSPRELEVLALVVADLCNEQIANHLSLSVRTVESHRRALLHKAGVRTPVGLAVRALREGWVAA